MGCVKRIMRVMAMAIMLVAFCSCESNEARKKLDEAIQTYCSKCPIMVQPGVTVLGCEMDGKEVEVLIELSDRIFDPQLICDNLPVVAPEVINIQNVELQEFFALCKEAKTNVLMVVSFPDGTRAEAQLKYTDF